MPLERWMKRLLRFAGAFNIVAGVAMMCLWRIGHTKLLGLAKPWPLPTQVMGALVLLFGVGYRMVARNPIENRNILILGWWSKAMDRPSGFITWW